MPGHSVSVYISGYFHRIDFQKCNLLSTPNFCLKGLYQFTPRTVYETLCFSITTPTLNITTLSVTANLIRTRMSLASEELHKYGTQVARPPHPALTQRTTAEGNAEGSLLPFPVPSTSTPSPAPGRGQRMGPIILLSVPSFFLPISHLDWIQIPWLPVSHPQKVLNVNFKLTPFLLFASLSHSNSQPFTDIFLLSWNEFS